MHLDRAHPAEIDVDFHQRLWCLVITTGVLVLTVLVLSPVPLLRMSCWRLLWTYPEEFSIPDDFEGFDNVTGVIGATIVPNIVHFVRFDQAEFAFLEFVCILSVLKRQQPDRIMFHTNLAGFSGRYWEKLKIMPGFAAVAEVVSLERPAEVFGQRFDPQFGPWHSTDVARILILMKYGGIFLDSDVYLVQSLDQLRSFEMSLGWPDGQYLGTQVLVAHKDARFLRMWLETYRAGYVPALWYYNAGARPTMLALHARPELVHRETIRLGVREDVIQEVYLHRYSAWRNQYLSIHLFSRHTSGLASDGRRLGLKYPVTFTEENIVNYRVTILDMALDVYPELLPSGH